jgi:hypothetical protein
MTEFDIDELLAKADKLMKMPKPRKKTKKRPRKSKAKSGNGYRYVYVDGKPKLEHRHIMEQHLKRALLPHESVYFKDKNRDNLKVDNLILGLKQGVPLSEIKCPHCEKKLG